MKRYAISDIHGNAYAFLKLLDHVDPDPEELVIVGDLCDRGLDTWGVYEETAQLIDEGATVVMGNHDLWFQQMLHGKFPEEQFKSEQIGGITTIRSIDLAAQRLGDDTVRHTVKKIYDNMVYYHEEDDYLFVHAGLDPRVPYLSLQKQETLLMGCPAWKSGEEHCYDQYVVFGHTPTWYIHKEITEEEPAVWMSHRARKIAIDTGAGFGRRLTMVDLIDGIAYAYDFSKRDIIEYRFKRKERSR